MAFFWGQNVVARPITVWRLGSARGPTGEFLQCSPYSLAGFEGQRCGKGGEGRQGQGRNGEGRECGRMRGQRMDPHLSPLVAPLINTTWRGHVKTDVSAPVEIFFGQRWLTPPRKNWPVCLCQSLWSGLNKLQIGPKRQLHWRQRTRGHMMMIWLWCDVDDVNSLWRRRTGMRISGTAIRSCCTHFYTVHN